MVEKSPFLYRWLRCPLHLKIVWLLLALMAQQGLGLSELEQGAGACVADTVRFLLLFEIQHLDGGFLRFFLFLGFFCCFREHAFLTGLLGFGLGGRGWV